MVLSARSFQALAVAAIAHPTKVQLLGTRKWLKLYGFDLRYDSTQIYPCIFATFAYFDRALALPTIELKTPRASKESRSLAGTKRHLGSHLLLALSAACLGFLVSLALIRGDANPVGASTPTQPVFSGIAYNGFHRYTDPFQQSYPSSEEVGQDLEKLRVLSKQVRTYSASEMPGLPAIAQGLGMQVTLGVWLERDSARHQKELEAARKAVREQRSIKRVILGNETLLREVFSLESLITQLDQFKAQSNIPLSTAEPWHIWLKYPRLVEHVDFITVHLLPYWEGVPHQEASAYALARYQELKKRFPNKPILIGEIGWPSQGLKIKAAQPSPAHQAQFLRDWLSAINALSAPPEYFLMEAIDQPWKRRIEGETGPYWGLFDVQRQIKGSLGFQTMLGANVIGFGAILVLLQAFKTFRFRAKVFLALSMQGIMILIAVVILLPLHLYFNLIESIGVALYVPALTLSMLTILCQSIEFAELYWPGSLRKRVSPSSEPLTHYRTPRLYPMVSCHLASCNEEPSMVIASIKSLAALDYPNFEMIVVDNNTSDEDKWRPVKIFCDSLSQSGVAIQFHHLPTWPGFKAGALNYALTKTDPTTQIIALVDSDYQVNSRWLADLTQHFDDPNLALVQAPQTHREWQHEAFRRFMNWEYEGFFRIGMHHRHERNAIIQHGTMCLIRKTDLLRIGAWSEASLCEDSELGLSLLEQGKRCLYIDEAYGTGLTPDRFSAFMTQRRRWAAGGMQILRKHWRSLLLPHSNSQLSLAQRYHFLAGWLPWINDALHFCFSITLILWTLGMCFAPNTFQAATTIFLVPIGVMLLHKLVLTTLLYRRLTDCSWADLGGAVLFGMGLSLAVARGVASGWKRGTQGFQITAKGKNKLALKTPFPVRGELILTLSFCAASLLYLFSGQIQSSLQLSSTTPISWLWLGVLALQSSPYVAALLCHAIAKPTQR